MKAILSLAVLSALVSCGPAPKLERRPEGLMTREKLVDGKTNLDTVSVSEVFRIKYENTVTLKCTLDVKAGNSIITDFREENLVGSNFKISPINLKADGHTVEVKIRPKTLGVFKNLTRTDFKENKYVMAHTPVATVDVSWKDTDSAGVVISGSSTIELYENLPDFYVTDMSKKGITEFFRCQLNATAVKEFQHEWEKIEAAPKIEVEEPATEPEATTEVTTPAPEVTAEEPVAGPVPETTPVVVVE
ncbi:MAG: hypothetical protein V4598_11920 [Bdellovibrionota bacterium]